MIEIRTQAEADAAVKFVACPVRLEDIAVHACGRMPHKIKARGCCAPVREVNEDGEKVDAQ